ncbi:AbrB family transcriptional regulator [Rossellomorea vietnamensis]|uniref:AbrB family transcriptional regulator n=1 Tax=Rossellomorea aquimaris TaxID=189382 RepID=A0A5D4TDB3_9BACI|nr:AbrB family transcriptional regulator [Rossellomorea aquimaris]TYS72064.1 AbrB family transcriptional regulator [Rossellomorea aquimaris]
MFLKFFYTLLIGLAGGWVFSLLHIPLAWMLGSMTAVFAAEKLTPFKVYWPPIFRNIGLIIVGYAIGQSFSRDTALEIFHQLPWMLFLTVLLLLFSGVLALFITKLTGINLKSTITGCIPGGLSQMVVLGEELEDIDVTVVTIIQVVRLLSVIFIVPFLAFSPLFQGAKDGLVEGPASAAFTISLPLLIFFAAAAASALIAVKLKLPTPTLLGPILGIGLLSASGIAISHMPDAAIIAAQIFLGIYFSKMMKFEGSGSLSKFIGLTVATSILLVSFTFGLGAILMASHHISFITSFLSMAPGGMAEMAIVGQALHADLSIITGYHLFRILFILFVVPIILKWLFRRKLFSPDSTNSGA